MNNVVPVSAGFDIGFQNPFTVGTLWFSRTRSIADLESPLDLGRDIFCINVLLHPLTDLPNYVASIYLITKSVPVRKPDL
jgi:hypothetical protein